MSSVAEEWLVCLVLAFVGGVLSGGWSTMSLLSGKEMGSSGRLFDLMVASGVRDARGSGESCAWFRPSQVMVTPSGAIFLREGITLKLLSLLDSTSASPCIVLGVACFLLEDWVLAKAL